MNQTEFKQRIDMLQNKLDMQFSDEQLAVLKNNYQQPVLINACAGAGKTTLLLISMVMQILDGVDPKSILSITFSRNAKQNMEDRFDDLIRKLDLPIDNQDYPSFRTFDALFLHLVRGIDHNVKIYGSKEAGKYSRQLRDAVQYHSEALSDQDVVKDLLEYKDALINHQYSTNGANLIGVSQNLEGFQTLAKKLGREVNNVFYQNYMSVIHTLLDIKQQNNYADFTDLKVRLNKMLHNSLQRPLVIKQLADVKRCFIDEFQDIDQVQWELVMNLLNDEAKNHLAVIGDDDQSIYTFRGSDPSIIISYPKKMPNAKVFNLTTNYRTSGPVLSAVTSMIEKNTYRMVKPLHVAKQNAQIGEIKRFDGNSNRLGGDLLLDQLVTLLQDPSVDHRQVAILCRNNMDLTLASDYLAQKGYYVALTNRNQILQFNRLYETILGLMIALSRDKFKQFESKANVIMSGFSRYQKHVRSVVKDQYQQGEPQSISEYLTAAAAYRNDHGVNREMDLIDRAVGDAVEDAKFDMPWDQPLKMLFKSVKKLTDGYYEWMINKKHLSGTQYELVMNHIETYIDDNLILPVEDFFTQEKRKRHRFDHIVEDVNNGLMQKDWIQGLTVHGSKGLEYQYVFVYNFRKNNLSKDRLYLNKWFYPHISRQDFTDQLLKINFGKFGKQIDQDENLDIWNVLSKLQFDFWNLQRTGHHDMIQAIIDDDPTQLDYNDELAENFNNVYDAVQAISQYIEEERRLVYVAMTRSSYATYYNEDLQDGVDLTTPLLDEVNVDDDHVMVSNAEGKVQTLAAYKAHITKLSGEVPDFTTFFS